MSDVGGTPPHHVDWEPDAEFQSRPHAELPPAEDDRLRARWQHVLMLGVAAFALWFLLYAPTLQHNAQVSPVGTRRTVSLDVTGPVAAVSRFLQLSHIHHGPRQRTRRTRRRSDCGGTAPGRPGDRVAAEVRIESREGG